jgi:hypothetical protein
MQNIPVTKHWGTPSWRGEPTVHFRVPFILADEVKSLVSGRTKPLYDMRTFNEPIRRAPQLRPGCLTGLMVRRGTALKNSSAMCLGGEQRGVRHDRHFSAASSFHIGLCRGRRMASSGMLARIFTSTALNFQPAVTTV